MYYLFRLRYTLRLPSKKALAAVNKIVQGGKLNLQYCLYH
jgi:hypothetical protein